MSKNLNQSKKAVTKPVVIERKSPIMSVRKRNGAIVSFDIEHISNAVYKAMRSTGEGEHKEADFIARKVESELKRISKLVKDFVPTVEGVQDTVEKELILEDYVKTAKAYILYREERARAREAKGEIPEEVKKYVAEGKKYFRNPMSEFVYYRTYSRWLPSEGRRETWIETVDRYMAFMNENLGNKLTEKEYAEVREAILKQEAMPSMRLLWSAGEAARKTNVTGYNCSFIAPSCSQDLGEIMYLLMCGTGVGYSVESQNAQMFPQIKKQTGKMIPTHTVIDSKEGWADAYVLGVNTWFSGADIKFDYSKLRPAGARLITMGGKSSGPEPLISLIDFTRERMMKKQGRRFSNLDLHDIVCKIGEVVVSGGVRRSALISLSDLDDHDMRHAKDGQFYLTDPQRMMANNSAVYWQKPSNAEFLDEWVSLMKGGSGERGIFNRGSIPTQVPVRRWKTLQKDFDTCGVNPCGEIILKSKQFCNLSEIVARADDTEESLLRKARIAAILGTYQSSLTNFGYLSKEWKENCEEERLLGVSITGQWDCKAVRDPKVMQRLRDEAVKMNKEYAKRFGINASAAVTAVKPSGTVSQLVDAASGMHPRNSQYYIRRIRIAATDSLFKMMKDQGVPYHPEVGQSDENAVTYVLEFPVKAPEKSIFKNDQTALDQLEYWKMVKENFTEHNPSVTISVGDDEWIAVANWIYSNWDIVGGLSFLPRSNHVYRLAPYEEISKEKYDEMVKKFPEIDFAKIVTYEREDQTQGSKELACVAGVCEIA
ncbi:MAG: ribonucleoside-triphosphate reductase [Candidatus Yonathbacteria bacterium RIFOXYC2_FULL_47_9]|nr:MAG: ribonucleoside-triphosphate reductase [Candidatus Yonathbacteria bacterium RIFOXYC2_FULL_47_9]HAT68086.1 ribonucleoside-triphosphate reductase [Candidatus Yonathbacteria bacterium]